MEGLPRSLHRVGTRLIHWNISDDSHQVVIADMSEEVLAKGTAVINKSLSRVAAKKYADDEEVSFFFP